MHGSIIYIVVTDVLILLKIRQNIMLIVNVNKAMTIFVSFKGDLTDEFQPVPNFLLIFLRSLSKQFSLYFLSHVSFFENFITVSKLC